MICAFLVRMLPRGVCDAWRRLVRFTSLAVNADRLLGAVMLLGLLLGVAIGLVFRYLGMTAIIMVFVVTFCLVVGITTALLSLMADRRAAAVEEVLPDALVLMSANLRAGMTVDRSLMLSGKHKIGILKDELGRVGRAVSLGKTLEAALADFSGTVRSSKLQGAVRLITSGIRSGGELSMLLDQLAKNMRHQELVEKKTRAMVSSYVTFIVIALAVVAPFLFALSGSLVVLLQGAAAGATVPMAGSDQGLLASTSLSKVFLTRFSVLVLVTAAMMGSLIIGSILRGKAISGIRYILPLGGTMVAMFFLVNYVVQVALQGFVS